MPSQAHSSKKWIWVTLQKEGIHRYPAAETEPNLATGDEFDVSFLAHPHRHIFHFKVYIEVFHNDRDLEFIQVKRQIEKWLGDGTLELDYKSCEMMADDLYKLIEPKWVHNYYGESGHLIRHRSVIIEVSEDNENGCRQEYMF